MVRTPAHLSLGLADRDWGASLHCLGEDKDVLRLGRVSGVEPCLKLDRRDLRES